MNFTEVKTGFAVYHAAKDVAADLKSRNKAALGAALSVLLALLLPFIQPLGAKYGLVIDAETMGYVHDGLLGIASLFLARHLGPGPAVAVVASNGAPGDAVASGQGSLDTQPRSQPADTGTSDAVRSGAGPVAQPKTDWQPGGPVRDAG